MILTSSFVAAIISSLCQLFKHSTRVEAAALTKVFRTLKECSFLAPEFPVWAMAAAFPHGNRIMQTKSEIE
jgi:hypothetical protein